MDVKGLFHVVDGKLLVRDVEVATVDQLFYGMTIKQTDDAQSYPGVRLLAFNSNDFYISQNTGNTDEATINLRGDLGGDAADPTVPGGFYGQVQWNQGNGEFGGATDFEYDPVDNQVLIPLGNSSKPGLAFKGDDDTGIFRAASNALGITGSGGERIRFVVGITTNAGILDSARLRSTVAGSDALCAFAFNSDNNTGMNNPLADNLALTAGGVEHIRIDGVNNKILFKDGSTVWGHFDRSKGRFTGGFYTGFGEPIVNLNAGSGITITRDAGGAPSFTIASTATGGAEGFYGMNVKHTDDSVAFIGIRTLAYNVDEFYVTQNAGNTDEAIINSKLGPAGAPGTVQFAGNSFDGRPNFKYDTGVGDGQVTVPPGNSSNHAMLFGATGFGITTHSSTMRLGNSPSTPNITIAPGDDEVKISNNKLKLSNTKGVWWGNFNITQSGQALLVKRDGNNVAQFVKSGESLQHRIVHPAVNPGIIGYSNTNTGISIQPTGNTSQVWIYCGGTLMGRFSGAGVKIGDNGGPAQPTETLDVDGRAVVRGRVLANAFYHAAKGEPLYEVSLAGVVDALRGNIETVDVKNYVVDEAAAYDYTIENITTRLSSGGCYGGFYINGTSVQGMDPFYISSTQLVATASGANTVSAGDRVTFSIPRNEAALDLAFTVKITRN
jgi:hypothetical protein